jgi:hypothetical protein
MNIAATSSFVLNRRHLLGIAGLSPEARASFASQLAAAGLVWLVQYYSSAEVAWHTTKLDQVHAQQPDRLARAQS